MKKNMDYHKSVLRIPGPGPGPGPGALQYLYIYINIKKRKKTFITSDINKAASREQDEKNK